MRRFRPIALIQSLALGALLGACAGGEDQRPIDPSKIEPAVELPSPSPVEPQPKEPETPIEVPDPQPAPPISFSEAIIPIFQEHCVSCHYAGARNVDFSPEHLAATLFESTPSVTCREDGETIERPFIVPGAPDESLLWIKVSDTDFSFECLREMPAIGTPLLELDPESAELIRAWISEGAPIDG